MIKVHIIRNSLLNSCTYILYNEGEEVYLIDCGDTEPILNFIQTNNKTIKGIFLTHCHYDHIYGINDVIKAFPNIIIYASKDTMVGLKNPRINLSKYHGYAWVVHENIELKEISERSYIFIYGEKINIIETPGHDIGCLSYHIENMLFTGDSYIPNVPVFTKWQRSDKVNGLIYEKQLKLFGEKQNLTIYPGHIV